jgi:phosphotransferase system enzyme I (PtsI)
LQGIAGAPGIVVGKAWVLQTGDGEPITGKRRIHPDEIPAQLARVESAIERAQADLVALAARLPEEPLGDSRGILDAYLAMMGDPMLRTRIERGIREERLDAESATSAAAAQIAALFGEAVRSDAYIAERRHDVEFVCQRLVRALQSTDEYPAVGTEPCIVIAHDLSPADTAAMSETAVLAFVTARGSRTSHTAIVARALEIPAVLGVDSPRLREIRTGDTVIVDGYAGVVLLQPSEADREEACARQSRYAAHTRRLASEAERRATALASGEAIELSANIELEAEVDLAVRYGAHGIGLFRTEFLYVNRATLPTEQEQYDTFARTVLRMAGRPVVLRTFDIGGDKFASSFALPEEMNPALGLRAIRLALQSPQVLLTQLRAMVRASALGDVRIMIPMVTTLAELRHARRLLAQAARDVGLAPPPLGIMVEVPAAAIMADVFAREAQFFSIGTNDLVQYALAVDRTSRTLASLASPFDPAVLRLVRTVVRAGADGQIPVSLCGAMAQEPLGALLLVGLGLRSLSMGAGALLEVGQALRQVTLAECEDAAQAALAATTADEAQRAVAERLDARLEDALRMA